EQREVAVGIDAAERVEVPDRSAAGQMLRVSRVREAADVRLVSGLEVEPRPQRLVARGKADLGEEEIVLRIPGLDDELVLHGDVAPARARVGVDEQRVPLP